METLVGIVGHRGYSGAELVRILQRHNQVEPILLEHREDGGTVAARRGPAPATLPCSQETVRSQQLAVVFLATPANVSIELAPMMLDAGARVIDLSGAFRLR